MHNKLYCIHNLLFTGLFQLNNWEEIKKHLISNDPQMSNLIMDYREPDILKAKYDQTNLFDSLINSIISQQLSTTVAKVIKSRLYSFKKTDQFTPEVFLEFKFNDMRSCGLSGAKCRYIKSISEICYKSPDFLNDFTSETNDQVIKELVNLSGVGEWTAQMFLIFGLNRLDVFAFKDVGLLKGIRHTYFDGEIPNISQIQDIVKKWKPYRTIGSWYMWQVANSL